MIKGNITFKGAQINDTYIKVSIVGIHSIIVREQGPSYDLQSCAIPGEPTEEELLTMTIPVKKHILNCSYSLKANEQSEQFGNGHEQIECDLDANLFAQAYSFLAEKFGISAEQV